LIDQEIFNQWERRISPFEQYVKRYTFPVFSTDGKNYELFGTSLGILISGKKYICTANHLIEKISETRADVVIAVNGKFESLNLDTVITIKNETIDYDVCLIELNGNPDHVPYLHQQEFYQDNNFDESWHFLLGFRISKNKYHDIHDHEKEMIKTNYLKSVFRVQQNIEHPFIGVSDKTHLLFELKESVYKKEDDLPAIELKKLQNMPGLIGHSGCGIWNINNTTIKLAGIFILFKSGIGAGTKAKCILELNNWSRIKH